jgi:uncharacterized protein (DUF983 family)
MAESRDLGSRRTGMSAVKLALIIVGFVLLGFLFVGIVVSNLRFFLWIAVVGLIVYAIVGLVMARRSS